MSSESTNNTYSPPERNLSWTQGMAIALGVPVLILPSIGYFALILGAFAIVAWMISVLQGFLQNLAYAELASRYPQAFGLPGFAQMVFKGKSDNEYNSSKFIGGFSAWGYWFAWNPVLAIYSLLLGDYLSGMVPLFANVNPTILSMCIGAVIFTALILVNYSGVSGGALLSYFLAALSLIPLVIISMAAIMSGHFQISNITNHWLPTDWVWDFRQILMIAGVMAMAQWSACAWETAAIYAPLYKNPKSSIPKALFGCGFICLITYFIVQTACTGALGLEGIAEASYSPMLSLARMTLGSVGAIITIVMLMASMVLIIQTGFLGSANAMAAMSDEGNLPDFFGKRNKHNVPIAAMISIAALNLIMITTGTPTSILAASAFGYVIANSVSLFAYVKASRDFHKMTAEENQTVFRAPKGWKYVALIFGLINMPIYCIGIIYLNVTDPACGLANTLIGIAIIFSFIPLWLYKKYSAASHIPVAVAEPK
jgi:amino acid transporter